MAAGFVEVACVFVKPKAGKFFSHCAAYSLHIADEVFVGQQTSNLDRTLNVM